MIIILSLTETDRNIICLCTAKTVKSLGHILSNLYFLPHLQQVLLSEIDLYVQRNICAKFDAFATFCTIELNIQPNCPNYIA